MLEPVAAAMLRAASGTISALSRAVVPSATPYDCGSDARVRHPAPRVPSVHVAEYRTEDDSREDETTDRELTSRVFDTDFIDCVGHR